MVDRYELDELIEGYRQTSQWRKLETLYIVARGLDGAARARDNMRIKLDDDSVVDVVFSDLGNLGLEPNSLHVYLPGSGKISDHIVEQISPIFPSEMEQRVAGKIDTFGPKQRLLLLMLWRKGFHLDGYDEHLPFDSYFKAALDLFFPTELTNTAPDAHIFIEAGLMYNLQWSSRKHLYHSFVPTPFSGQIWETMPSRIPTSDLRPFWMPK